MSPPKPWQALRHHLALKSLSARDLADRSGLSKSFIEHLIAGRRNPSDRTVKRLADALEVSIDVLRPALAARPGDPATLLQIQQELGAMKERVDELVLAHPALQKQEVA